MNNLVKRYLLTLLSLLVLGSELAIAKTCRGFSGLQPDKFPEVIQKSRKGRSEVYNEYLKIHGIARFVQIPDSAYDIYFENGDFPVQTIQNHARQSQKFWENLTSKETEQFNKNNFDWVTYKELNYRASLLWSEMLKCNLNDSTAMRLRYFTGELCSTKGIAEELKKKISMLTVNLIEYLSTSEKIDLASDEITPFQHPLLQQIALQIYSVSEVTVFDNPSVEQLLGFSFYMEPPSPATRNLDAQQRNNLSALIFSRISNCSALGLWPAMNRAFMRPPSDPPPIAISELAWNAYSNSEKLCGVPVETFTQDNFSRFSYAHVRQMRRLFTAYFPTELVNKAILKLKSEHKLDIESDLKCVK